MLAEVRPEPRAEQEGFHWGPGRAGAALVFPDPFSVNPAGRWSLSPTSKGGFARLWLGKVLTQLAAPEGSQEHLLLGLSSGDYGPQATLSM